MMRFPKASRAIRSSLAIAATFILGDWGNEGVVVAVVATVGNKQFLRQRRQDGIHTSGFVWQIAPLTA